VVIVPGAAIQRGPQGTFVYVVKADQTVEIRPITVGPTAGDQAVIETGLAPGEQIVTDGVDKLRAGSLVRAAAPENAASGRQPNA
jgi:multidrug efflux system membrane fusion protein